MACNSEYCGYSEPNDRQRLLEKIQDQLDHPTVHMNLFFQQAVAPPFEQVIKRRYRYLFPGIGPVGTELLQNQGIWNPADLTRAFREKDTSLIRFVEHLVCICRMEEKRAIWCAICTQHINSDSDWESE